MATAEAGPEGGAKATGDPSGWSQSLTRRATAEGRGPGRTQEAGPEAAGGGAKTWDWARARSRRRG